jgi:hypothetical protein
MGSSTMSSNMKNAATPLEDAACEAVRLNNPEL